MNVIVSKIVLVFVSRALWVLSPWAKSKGLLQLSICLHHIDSSLCSEWLYLHKWLCCILCMLHIMYDLTKISYIFISILYIVFANLSKKFGYILYFIRIKDNYIDDLYSHFVQIHSEHNYNTSPLCHSERSVSGVEESMWVTLLSVVLVSPQC